VTVNAFSDLVVTVELSPNIDTGAPIRDADALRHLRAVNCSPPNTGRMSCSKRRSRSRSPRESERGLGRRRCRTCRAARMSASGPRPPAHQRAPSRWHQANKQFTASFVATPARRGLAGCGNFNDDLYIDILDSACTRGSTAATTDGNTACATPHPTVTQRRRAREQRDFTFLQINFVQGHEDNAVASPASAMRPPVLRISSRSCGARPLRAVRGD